MGEWREKWHRLQDLGKTSINTCMEEHDDVLFMGIEIRISDTTRISLKR